MSRLETMTDDRPARPRPSTRPGARVRRTLVSDGVAPATARRVVREIAVGLPAELVERASLAVSEVVTNAVRHGSDPGAPIDLVVQRSGDRLTLCVCDDGRTVPAVTTGAGGFGLDIVRRVADELTLERGSTWEISATFKPRIDGRAGGDDPWVSDSP